MIVGANKTNEIIIREFVESSPQKLTIYKGMPLNTEFRVFYDFDSKKILGIFNYWDKDTMLNNFSINELEEDRENFIKMIPNIEKEFSEYKEYIKKEVIKNMRNVKLQGQWSIDIMKIENQFYLIDMALAKQSYYYEKIKK